jgi:type IV secretory pathway VirB2 component (pilin)
MSTILALVAALPLVTLLAVVNYKPNAAAPARPTDQQLDQVVMAIQGLATHHQAVLRGREILKGFLYRWGNSHE